MGINITLLAVLAEDNGPRRGEWFALNESVYQREQHKKRSTVVKSATASLSWEAVANIVELRINGGTKPDDEKKLADRQRLCANFQHPDFHSWYRDAFLQMLRILHDQFDCQYFCRPIANSRLNLEQLALHRA